MEACYMNTGGDGGGEGGWGSNQEGGNPQRKQVSCSVLWFAWVALLQQPSSILKALKCSLHWLHSTASSKWIEESMDGLVVLPLESMSLHVKRCIRTLHTGMLAPLFTCLVHCWKEKEIEGGLVHWCPICARVLLLISVAEASELGDQIMLSYP